MRWHPNPPVDRWQWHKVFAWTPIKTTDGLKVWLETVERKAKWHGFFPGAGAGATLTTWEYRLHDSELYEGDYGER